MNPDQDILQAVRLAAIAGAVKDRAAGEAKKLIPDGSSHQVDVSVRIRGVVTKGLSEPPTSGQAAVQVDLFRRGVMLDVMRRLKIVPAQLRAALRAATKHIDDASQLDQLGQGVIAQYLASVFEQVTTETAGRLPAQTWNRPGRAGPVRVDVTVEPIEEIKPCLKRSAAA